MNVAEYLVDFFINNGITDIFGIPGGVVLDLLYALEKRPEIRSHLSYHEQAAAFEACGYAQVNYSLGAAYATRGPGFTNLITGIADAYADSIPVIFVTAHSGKSVTHEQRFEAEQEMDTVQMVRYITKYAAVVDDLEDVCPVMEKAACLAMTGRKGPVLLDFSASLWSKEITCVKKTKPRDVKLNLTDEYCRDRQLILNALMNARKPIYLLGDGVRQAGQAEAIAGAVDQTGFPVLTSRGAQDIGKLCKNYYGYIGSHGMRYSNFIFAKADLVIALGNRLAFPPQSESFKSALANKTILWVEIDENERKRTFPNTININIPLEKFCDILISFESSHQENIKWLHICRILKDKLHMHDTNEIVDALSQLMKHLSSQFVLVSDVGNHEFWTSRSYELCDIPNRFLYSKSFGALGCGLAKAIGASCQTRKPSVCFVGDQGFQLNLQELELIAKENLPILIVIVNNRASGMIKDRQDQLYAGHNIHTTSASGYGVPEIALLAKTYGIKYLQLKQYADVCKAIEAMDFPLIVEGIFDQDIPLTPALPKGNPMQNMIPELNRDLYESLEQL